MTALRRLLDGLVTDVGFSCLRVLTFGRGRLRLLEPIGDIPPAEAEERYYAMLDETQIAA